MIAVDIRKQGGAAIMTIPAHVLKMLHVEIGSKLYLDIRAGTLIAKPAHHAKTRKRYSLNELLVGITPKRMKALNKATAWAREGEKQGRELI